MCHRQCVLWSVCEQGWLCRISFISPLWIWLRRTLAQLLGCKVVLGEGEVLFISGQEVPLRRAWVATDARGWVMWPDLIAPFSLWEQGKDNRCTVCTRNTGNWLWDYGTKWLWNFQVGKALRDDLKRTYFLIVEWGLKSRGGKSFTFDHIDLTLTPKEVSGTWTRKRGVGRLNHGWKGLSGCVNGKDWGGLGGNGSVHRRGTMSTVTHLVGWG